MTWKAETKRAITILLLAVVLGVLIGAIAASRMRFRLLRW